MIQKSYIFSARTPILHKKRAGTVGFLIQQFSFFGFEVQNWMLIVVFLIAAFAVYVWQTRDKV
jgi:hypothetical protein